jgi:hypothetical protein
MQRGYSYDTNLVLRTVYLPRELDNQLRHLAYQQRKSKNEVIRSILQTALDQEASTASAPEQSEGMQGTKSKTAARHGARTSTGSTAAATASSAR